MPFIYHYYVLLKKRNLKITSILQSVVIITICIGAETMASEDYKLGELELIRTEAIRFLEQERPFKWDVHVVELKRGGIMLPTATDGWYRIGIWVFDFETLTLLRQADIVSGAPDVSNYGLVFQKDSTSKYQVVRDFWERLILDWAP